VIGRIIAIGLCLPIALSGQAPLDVARFVKPSVAAIRIDTNAIARGLTPEQLRAALGLAVVRGVRPADLALAGDWLDPASPLNPALPDMLTWTARVAELAQGTSAARMAVVLQKSDSASRQIVQRLEQLQAIFDVVTEEQMVSATPGPGELRVAGQRYHAVLLGPVDTLPGALATRLVTLARQAGTVIAWRPLPAVTRWPDTSARFHLVDSLPDLREALLRTPWSGVREPGPPALRLRALQRGEDNVFLLFNNSERRIAINPTFRFIGQPELWNPDDGTMQLAPTRWSPRLAVTDVPIEMDPYQLIAIVFRARPRSPRGPVGPPPLERTVARGAPDWRFHFATGDTTVRTVTLGPWTTIDSLYSGLGVYEGTMELRTLDRSSRYWLDLGQVRDVAEVDLNGTPLGRRLWRPYRYEVTKLVREGTNQLTVRVRNTSANRLGKPQPSGLLGSVRMILVR
jgi:hypothetical protein